jgi:pimeloyl-ACP methyl ester carboxylesterase
VSAVSGWPEARLVELPRRGAEEPITLAVHEAGDGPAVVLSHGFPELAYSWRHQLPAIAAAGFHAIAPDQRGYGGSSAPRAIEAYRVTDLAGDLVRLLDALGIERAVFVGHDWGGLVVWAMPILHPDRTAGVVGVCTPYIPFPPLDALRAMVEGEASRHYILWFQEPGVAEREMDRKVATIFDKLMRAPLDPAAMLARLVVDGKLDFNPFRRIDELPVETPAIVSAEELEVYVRTFERTGFAGGVNWYRNLERDAREIADQGRKPLDLPCLMITAEWDVALPPAMAAGMPALIADLEMRSIERAGHWVQQERPDEVNAILVDWLRRRFGG